MGLADESLEGDRDFVLASLSGRRRRTKLGTFQRERHVILAAVAQDECILGMPTAASSATAAPVCRRWQKWACISFSCGDAQEGAAPHHSNDRRYWRCYFQGLRRRRDSPRRLLEARAGQTHYMMAILFFCENFCRFFEEEEYDLGVVLRRKMCPPFSSLTSFYSTPMVGFVNLGTLSC